MKNNIGTQALLKVLALPASIFLAHSFLDFGLHIYRYVPWFDIPMHFIGGASIGFAVVVMYRELRRNKRFPPLFFFEVLFLGTAVVMLVAVWWEFAEFLADTLFSTHMQPSVADTMLDLLLGMLGGALTIMLYLSKFFAHDVCRAVDQPTD